ncbi:MAG: phage tail protein [Magnetococcales bacterium]|nr:phage tail protein [Magnetococcales bacterium]
MESYLGEIKLFAGSRIPRYWLACNGQTLSINEYSDLYALYGTTYGGDGISSFSLPDMRGRIPLHQGTAPFLSSRFIGEKAGTETVKLTVSHIPQHDHDLNGITDAADSNDPQNRLPAKVGDKQKFYTEAPGTANANMYSGAIASTGSDNAHENRQPTLGLNFIVCVHGVFPKRS